MSARPGASGQRRWRAAGWLLLGVAAQVPAAPLPDPLTLADALRLAGENHPSLAVSQAALAASEAGADAAAARDDLTIGAHLRGRLIDPSGTADDQGRNDSRATLYASKRLYDFGHTQALEAAADTLVAGSRLQFAADQAEYRVQVIKAFFDVLLADLEYTRDNEAMAVAYVRADRIRDRNELEQVSDIVLLKQEDAYQQTRMRRLRSQARQRASRARLAQLLDRPDDLPSNLARPELPDNDQPLPDYQQLVDAALARNPRVLALKSELDAARLRVRAERAGGRPVLSGSVSASAYERNMSGYNPLEAELRLDIPLYEGNRVNADVARAQAEKYRLEASLRQMEYDLRQKVLETWLDLQTLLAQREQVKVFSDARERNFELAQAEYELELNTDFGDSLVGQSDSALLSARTEFQLAIDWARLSALTAGAYSPYLQELSPPQPGNERHETQPR